MKNYAPSPIRILFLFLTLGLELDIMSDHVSVLLTRYKELNLQDVLDHERFNDLALRYVLDAAIAKKALTVEFIQQINALVMKNTGSIYNTVLGEIDASKGMFRKGNVSAGGSYFPNYDKVILYTTDLVKRLDDNLQKVQDADEQLKLSFSAHFDLVSIHPFCDGNGHTSLLLMNYIQAYHRLPLAIVFKEDKADYYVAPQETRKQEDMQVFYNFMFGQYRKQLEQEITSYTEAMSQKIEPKKGKGPAGYSLFF